MNKLLTILFVFCSLSGLGQVQSHDFIQQDSQFVAFGSERWTYRIQYPKDYFTPGHPDHWSNGRRPVLLFMPGQSEVGNGLNTPSLFTQFGPFRERNRGWDGGVQLANGRHYPILITILITYANPRGPQIQPFISFLSDRYKFGDLHWIGFSMGGFTAGKLIAYQSSAGNESGMKLLKSFVSLQGAGFETFSPYNAWSLGNASYGRWASKYGGKFFGVEGTADTRNLWQHRNNMHDSVPNSAYFTYTNLGGGAHCCYNDMMDTARKNWTSVGTLGPNIATNGTPGQHNSMGTYIPGDNIWTWAFRQGDTTMVGAVIDPGEPDPPIVNAGTDRTITLPKDSIHITGTATPGYGATIVSTIWSKLTGGAATITDPSSLTTTVTGLEEGSYSFQLAATDDEAQTSYDTINVTVNPVPPVYTPPRITVGPGEYAVFFLDMNKLPWGMGANTFTGGGGGGTTGVPQRVVTDPTDLKFKGLAGALHGGGGIDTAGNVWIMGDGGQGQYGNGTYTTTSVANKILTDTSGAPFTNIDTLVAFFYKDGGDGYNGFYAVKDDGTLWVWGRVWKGMSGNGEDYTGVKDYTRPTQIVLPDDRRVKMITCGQTVAVLCTDGTVWTWGITTAASHGRPATTEEMCSPHQLESLGTDNVYIAGSWTFWYALKSNGQLFGWGSQGNFFNDPTHPTGGGVSYPTPTNIDNQVTNLLSAPIVKIQVNFFSTAVLCADGTVWTWGDNSEGSIGNGFKYQHANPYAWNFNTGLALVKTPYNVGSGKKWKDVWGGTNYGFYWYALDAEDNLYSWGRNKGSVIANQVRGANAAIVATYQDSWNVEWPRLVDPFNISATYQQTSPVCIDNPSGSPCNTFTIPANTKPTANAGSNQSIAVDSTVLNASASTDNVFIAYYEWKQVSGPNTAIIETPGNAVTKVRGLVDGTYTFRIVTTDNGWMADSTTMTVTVGDDANMPPYFTGWKSTDTLTLPADSVRLIAQGVDDDGTIESYTWSVISAPTAPVILEDTNDTTWVHGLDVTGNYTFRCTITDDDGGSAYADITVTVLAQPGNTTNRTFNVNLTDGTYHESGWTNWNLSAGLTSQTFVDDEGGSSTYYATISANDFTNGNTNSYGVTFIPDNVVRTVSFFTSNRTLTIQGLQSGVMYNLYLYSTRNNSGNTTRFTVGGNSINIVSSQNTSDSVKFFNIEPSAGTITVSLERVGGSYNYLNGFTLVEIGTGNADEPPVAEAGSNQTITLPTSTVTLDASSSTPGTGDIVSYAWTQLSGPSSATIVTPSSISTDVSGLTSPGVYNFQVLVTDENELSSSDVVSVTVVGNSAPAVDAGLDQAIVLPTTSTNLSGSVVPQGDATITSVLWTKESGPSGGDISDPSSVDTDITDLEVGPYVYRLTATDSYSQTSYDEVTITVSMPEAPVVNAGVDQTIVLPADATVLEGSANGEEVTLLWAKQSGPSGGNITSPTELTTTVTDLEVGTYVYRLTATDIFDQSSYDEVTVTVITPPEPVPGIKIAVRKRKLVIVEEETPIVNVLEFREGRTDHEMIQAAIDFAKDSAVTFVPGGTYMITATGTFLQSGLLMRNGTRLRLASDAVIRAIPNSSTTYAVVTANGVSNVTIEGGTIQGERHEHTGSTGEGGHNIVIVAAENVTIKNLTTRDAWGDGIYIRNMSKNIIVENVIGDGNRRQGMSVISANGMISRNNIWRNTIGTNPQAGIDLEPNNMNDTVRNVQIIGDIFENNNVLGLHIYSNHGPVHDIFIKDCQMIGNPIGFSVRFPRAYNIVAENTTITGSTNIGFRVVDSAHSVTVDGMNITTAAGTGVRLEYAENVDITGLYVQAHAAGISTNRVSNISVSNSNIQSFGSTGNGISLSQSNQINFSAVNINGWNRGINSVSTNYVNLINSTITGSVEYGAYISNNRYSTFDYNTFSGNQQVGFYIRSGSDGYNQIADNQFINNGLNGSTMAHLIVAESARRNTLTRNLFRTSTETNRPLYAIRLDNTTSLNSASGNTYEAGSYVTSPVANEGTNNTTD